MHKFNAAPVKLDPYRDSEQALGCIEDVNDVAGEIKSKSRQIAARDALDEVRHRPGKRQTDRHLECDAVCGLW